MQPRPCLSPHSANLRFAPAGTTLFNEGDTCDHVFELHEGVVRGVTHAEDGNRQVTAFFFAGDQIGIPVTADYRYSAEPVTPISYVRHAHGSWCNALIESCRSDGRLLKSIGAEQDPVFRRGILIGRAGALPRVAAFLVSVIDRLAIQYDGGLYFPIPQIDIASYLALTPETVCRSLRKLKTLGMIDMPTHDRLVVYESSRLELAAHSLIAA